MEYFIKRPHRAPDVVRRAAKTTSRHVGGGAAGRRGPTPSDIARMSAGAGEGLTLSDRYRLERVIGRGGMGTVYLAEQLGLGRKVAIKILDVEKLDISHAISRFLHEAQLAARVHHANVVEVFDCGSTPEGVVYIVMEHLEGRDLRTMLRQGPMSWRWARYMMCQIGAGVGAIHELGIVHRDLKASNCFFAERSATVKVLDFGIATTQSEADAARSKSVVGTPEYMSPEQIRGEKVDLRADVYSAGILLYELLTGVTPFRAYSAEALFDLHLHAEVPGLASGAPRGDFPPGLDDILCQALEKEPSDRFATMSEFCHALRCVDEPRSASRWFRRLLGDDGQPTMPRMPRMPAVDAYISTGPEEGLSQVGAGVREGPPTGVNDAPLAFVQTAKAC